MDPAELAVTRPEKPRALHSRDLSATGNMSQWAAISLGNCGMEGLRPEGVSYRVKSSRRRLVCWRETGISDCFLSSILIMKLDLNQGTTSLMWWMLTR